MKVLLFGTRMFSGDMLWGFLQAGCDAKIISASTAEQMEDILGRENADLLITLGAPTDIYRAPLEYLGRRPSSSTKYIHWDTDGISSLYYPSKSGDGIEMDLIYLAKPSFVFTMCPEMLDFLRSKGIRSDMLHYAYSPGSHRPLPDVRSTDFSISLIGSSYAYFANRFPKHYRYESLKILVKPLLENGFAVHIHGDTAYPALIKSQLGIELDPSYYHGYMYYDKTCAAYNRAYINLATQNHQQTITKRTFEILGSGGFLLSSANAALRQFFEPGRDLTVSSSPEETLEIVEYYKNNPDKWQTVRENAVKSVQNHTYKQRAEYILSMHGVF